MDGIDNLAETAYSLLKLCLIREIDVIVSLHTDTVDGHTCILHLLHHIIDTLALTLIYTAVIVVDKNTCRISLTRKLECLCDKLITAELEMTALAIGAGRNHLAINKFERTTIICHCLVYHIPSINHILIAVYYRVDMLTQTLVEHFLLYWLAFLIGKHPVSKL